MRWGVVVFPGSNCDHDAYHVLKHVLGQDARLVWHQETDLQGLDVVILPGGFSYGDYLRAGALAAFSPVLGAVRKFAANGGLVAGICNGFQILVECGLLPGALVTNRSLSFICREVHVRVERNDTPFTRALSVGDVLRMPIAHQSGNYLAGLEGHGGAPSAKKRPRLRRGPDRPGYRPSVVGDDVVFRYCDENGGVTDEANPNGSFASTAGIVSAAGNVLGMMPHPERASESVLGSADGRKIFESILAGA